MDYRKTSYMIISLLFVLAIILGVIISHIRKADLRIAFLDVGQGDSILISQGSNQILIDGGKDGKVLLEKIGRFMPFWDRSVEIVIATHPDHDHISGLIDVLRAYNVHSFLETKAKSDSATYKKLEEEIGGRNIEKIETAKGLKVLFPGSGELEVLYPFGSIAKVDEKNSNENSIVAKFRFGESSFLLTGDITEEKEKELVASGADLATEVLKVSHHGSKYSTGDEFLSATDAKSAVISVGKNNSYGHPSDEVLRKLSKHGVEIYRTDEIGDIFYKCEKFQGKCMVANQSFL
ncbi:MAG TPA: MBL fold metallo-hydrolase [Candidatus Moranbacteria bacterium]|jgi:competence protein ComEC|nr:MBL fold metallo-hydrolase [Candidatus Moranbacteria bacterium]HOF42572.1 MBL fold metallo-hydrolase [Candidatus Moranbacteria bacterium]HPX94336.1 MBL fold metallo-hydrolase [Candidatus Moranbacteria bacterium]HQB59465.1 MBL fold metallo-hydrolase [Candidatus Moranbacteria bacterium]